MGELVKVILRLILLGLSHSCEPALNLLNGLLYCCTIYRLKRLSLETFLFGEYCRDIVHMFSYKHPGRTLKKP